MKDAELQVFVDSLRYYFTTSIPGLLEVADAYHTATIDTPTNECTGIIGVSGEKQGCIYMTASRAMLGDVLLAMGEPEVDDSLINDVIGEITNTVAGNARRVFGSEFMISVPLVVTGLPEQIQFPKNHDVGVIPFNWNGHTASLVVCLQ
jgi:chemotaxis protein CheX